MPRGNQTGPNGQGPMTGRANGSCGDNNTRFVGNGRGNGTGRGVNNNAGYRYSNPTITLEQEKENLKRRLDEIDSLNKK